MAVGMSEAEKLKYVWKLSEELAEDFEKRIPDAAANKELKRILAGVKNVYKERHTVVHAIFVKKTSDGKLARFFSDRPNVRVKAIDYGVELEKLRALRNELRTVRDTLNRFTKKWLLGKSAEKNPSAEAVG